MHYFKLENTHKKKTQIQEDIMRQKEMKGKMQMKAEWLKFPLLNQFARLTDTDIHVSSDVGRGGGEGGGRRDWHFSISNWMSLWTTSFQQCFNRSQGYTNLYAIRKFFFGAKQGQTIWADFILRKFRVFFRPLQHTNKPTSLKHP